MERPLNLKVSMKKTLLILFIPLIVSAQPLEWQSQGIPVEQDGYIMPVPWLGGENHSSFSFCDINGDSLLDVFIGNSYGDIWLLTNTGITGFESFEFSVLSLDSLSTNSTVSPAVSDIDGDSDLDLFIVDWDGWKVLYYQNIGNINVPIFEFVVDSLEGLPYVSCIAFQDLDNDDDYDVIAGNGYNGIIVYYEKQS